MLANQGYTTLKYLILVETKIGIDYLYQMAKSQNGYAKKTPKYIAKTEPST